MKITGICLISKDQSTKNPKLEFAKTQGGADIVKGSIYWLTSKKNEPKSYSNIRFVAYKEMVNFFRDNCNEMIEITNSILKSYSGEKKDGTKYYGHEVTIFEARVYQKKEPVQSFHEKKEPEDKLIQDLGDDIPW